MKQIILLLTLAAAQICQAEITNASYDRAHTSIIAEAIKQKCNVDGAMRITASTEQSVSVDNGITDIYYTTEVQIQEKMDQFSSATMASVKSMKSDMYDHSTKNWGAYSVISVECAY